MAWLPLLRIGFQRLKTQRAKSLSRLTYWFCDMVADQGQLGQPNTQTKGLSE